MIQFKFQTSNYFKEVQLLPLINNNKPDTSTLFLRLTQSLHRITCKNNNSIRSAVSVTNAQTHKKERHHI